MLSSSLSSKSLKPPQSQKSQQSEREQIARKICSTWQQLNTAQTSFDSQRFLNDLLGSNVVELVGTFHLPLDGLSSESEGGTGPRLESGRGGGLDCHALVNGTLSWTWSGPENAEAAPTAAAAAGSTREKCTSLHINLESVNLLYSKKKVEGNKEGGPYQDRNLEGEKCFSICSELTEWLQSVAAVSEINIEVLNVQFESGINLDQIFRVFYTAMNTNFLGLFSNDFAAKSLKQNDKDSQQLHTYHRVKIKEINIQHDNESGRSLNGKLSNYFCCGPNWSLEGAFLSIPILTYQLDIDLSGIRATFYEKIDNNDKELDAKIQSVNAIRWNDGVMTKALKNKLRYTSMSYGKEGLKIDLADHVIFLARLANEPKNFSHVPIHHRLEIHVACSLTQEPSRDREITPIVQGALLSLVPLLPFDSTLSVNFDAKQLSFGKVFIINSFTCQCCIDTATRFADNFSANAESASFNVDSNLHGMDWLLKRIQYEDINAHPFTLPFAQISPVEVTLIPKGWLTPFQGNIIQMGSIDGDGECTSSQVIIRWASKLLDEATKRKRMQKDKRVEVTDSVADSVAMTAGSMVMGASLATPVGAAVAVASLGVRDTVGNAVGSAVAKGKESRGASDQEGYRFGDFSRGVVRHFSSSGSTQRKDQVCDEVDERKFAGSQMEQTGKPSVLKDKKRLAGVGGMTAGAAVGTVLLGPLGFVAGSLIGSRVAKSSVGGKDHKENVQDNSGDNIRNNGGEFDSTERSEEDKQGDTNAWWRSSTKAGNRDE